MDLKGKKIILGSNSPRRKELLKGLDIDFVIDTDNSFEEIYSPDIPGEDVPRLMSEGKSNGFHRKLEDNELLLTADTMVLCGNTIMGKPKSRIEAIEMLNTLSGKEHKVITSVTLRSTLHTKTITEVSKVTFSELSESEIVYYIDKYKPYDKAGSYGIQEWIGYIGIERIEGSYFNIMGLPTHLVYKELQLFINQDLQ
jgi:hypothetical protein